MMIACTSRVGVGVAIFLSVSFPVFLAHGEPKTDIRPNFFDENYAQSVEEIANVNDRKKLASPIVTMSNGSEFSTVQPGVAHGTEASLSGPRLSLPNPVTGDIPHAVDNNIQRFQREIAVPRVQLFVNSSDSQHLSQVITKALALHSEGRVFLVTIYHIGDYRTLSAVFRRDLEQQQIPYLATASVHYGDGVKLSPTWAFMTLDGVRIVEGVLNPERYLDNHGLESSNKKLDAIEKSRSDLVGW